MGLSKSIMTGYGVAAQYWKVSRVEEDFVNKIVTVTMTGFVSKEVSETCGPIDQFTKQFYGDDYVPDMTREQVYQKLKDAEAIPENAGVYDLSAAEFV